MAGIPADGRQVATIARSIGQRLMTIGENRAELLIIEVQEERERLLHAFLLALAVAAFGLLAAMAVSAVVAVAWWGRSPVGVLSVLAGLYGTGAIALGWRLRQLLRDWQAFPASLDQLRKDRACLHGILA